MGPCYLRPRERGALQNRGGGKTSFSPTPPIHCEVRHVALDRHPVASDAGDVAGGGGVHLSFQSGG